MSIIGHLGKQEGISFVHLSLNNNKGLAYENGSKRIRSCMLEHGITSPFIIFFFQYRSYMYWLGGFCSDVFYTAGIREPFALRMHNSLKLLEVVISVTGIYRARISKGALWYV